MSGVRLSRAYLPGMKQRNWGRNRLHLQRERRSNPRRDGALRDDQDRSGRSRPRIAETCAGTAVTVNSVLAGPTASEGVVNFVAALAKEQGTTPSEFEKEFFRGVRPTSLLKRFIEPEEVAALVVFVCSPEAAAINGAALRADGRVVKAAL